NSPRIPAMRRVWTPLPSGSRHVQFAAGEGAPLRQALVPLPSVRLSASFGETALPLSLLPVGGVACSPAAGSPAMGLARAQNAKPQPQPENIGDAGVPWNLSDTFESFEIHEHCTMRKQVWLRLIPH